MSIASKFAQNMTIKFEAWCKIAHIENDTIRQTIENIRLFRKLNLR